MTCVKGGVPAVPILIRPVGDTPVAVAWPWFEIVITSVSAWPTEAVVGESAGGHAAQLLGDEEHGGGNLFGEAGAPGDLLEGHALGPIFVGGEIAKQQLREEAGGGRWQRVREVAPLVASC